MATTPTTGSGDQSVIANFKTAQEEATGTHTPSKKSNSRETKYVSVEQPRTKKTPPDGNSPMVFQPGTPVVKLATQGRSDAEIADAAKKLHNMVKDKASDGDFNATWRDLNLSADEKKRVFEEMAKLPGGIGHFLDAKAGRKFTQPMNEFGQWAVTHRGAEVADFIASKGNDWNDGDYNGAYKEWVQLAENKNAFFDRTAAIGFDHWQGLRGTRNKTSLVMAIFKEITRSDASNFASIAKLLHDAVNDKASDADFNATWQKLNLSSDEKKKVFAEMAKLPGGIGHFLDAKAGRKFTQPMNEFAQWAVTNRGAEVADFIARKGNEWNDLDYTQAYTKWVEPAEGKNAFFDRTTAIGFNHWDGLDGTRSDTMLVRAILREGVGNDSSDWAKKAAEKLAGEVDRGDGGPNDIDFDLYYEKYVGYKSEAADNLAASMSDARDIGFWLNAKHSRKFTAPITNFVQWAIKNKPAETAQALRSVANDWSNEELDNFSKHYLTTENDLKTENGLTSDAIEEFKMHVAFADEKDGAKFWLDMKGSRERTEFVKDIVRTGIQRDGVFAQQVAQYLWDHVKGSNPDWNNEQIGTFMLDYVNDENKVQMGVAMGQVQPDGQAWLHLHGTRSTASVNWGPTIADVAQVKAPEGVIDPNNKEAVDKALEYTENREKMIDGLMKDNIDYNKDGELTQLSRKLLQDAKQAQEDFKKNGGKGTFTYVAEPSIDAPTIAKMLGMSSLGPISATGQSRFSYSEQIQFDANGNIIQRNRGIRIRSWSDVGPELKMPGFDTFHPNLQNIESLFIPLAVKEGDGKFVKGGDIMYSSLYGFMHTMGFKAPRIVDAAKTLYSGFYTAYEGLRQGIRLPPVPNPFPRLGEAIGWPLGLPNMPVPQLPQSRLDGLTNAATSFLQKSDVSTEASVGLQYTINLSKVWKNGSTTDKLLVTGSMLGSFAAKSAGMYLTSYLGQKIAARYGGATAENLARVRNYMAIGTTAATAGWFGLQAGVAAARGYLESFNFAAYFLFAPRPGPYAPIIPSALPIGPAQEGQVVPADEWKIGRLRALNVLSYAYPIWKKPDAPTNPELK